VNIAQQASLTYFNIYVHFVLALKAENDIFSAENDVKLNFFFIFCLVTGSS